VVGGGERGVDGKLIFDVIDVGLGLIGSKVSPVLPRSELQVRDEEELGMVEVTILLVKIVGLMIDSRMVLIQEIAQSIGRQVPSFPSFAHLLPPQCPPTMTWEERIAGFKNILSSSPVKLTPESLTTFNTELNTISSLVLNPFSLAFINNDLNIAPVLSFSSLSFDLWKDLVSIRGGCLTKMNEKIRFVARKRSAEVGSAINIGITRKQTTFSTPELTACCVCICTVPFFLFSSPLVNVVCADYGFVYCGL
jgi:hypothetical protein